MTSPTSCPGCGAPHEPACRYCGRSNGRDRMLILDAPMWAGEMAVIRESLRLGRDGCAVRPFWRRGGKLTFWNIVCPLWG